MQSVTAEFDLSMRALRNVLAMPINAIEVCMPFQEERLENKVSVDLHKQ